MPLIPDRRKKSRNAESYIDFNVKNCQTVSYHWCMKCGSGGTCAAHSRKVAVLKIVSNSVIRGSGGTCAARKKSRYAETIVVQCHITKPLIGTLTDYRRGIRKKSRNAESCH